VLCFRGIATGIYTTNSPEACHYCAVKSRANIIVVEDKKQLDKILSIKDRLPELKAIVQYSGKPEAEGVISVRNNCRSKSLWGT
jgi:long-chain-fatty-acid--CoA ligase ACSBG